MFGLNDSMINWKIISCTLLSIICWASERRRDRERGGERGGFVSVFFSLTAGSKDRHSSYVKYNRTVWWLFTVRKRFSFFSNFPLRKWMAKDLRGTDAAFISHEYCANCKTQNAQRVHLLFKHVSESGIIVFAEVFRNFPRHVPSDVFAFIRNGWDADFVYLNCDFRFASRNMNRKPIWLTWEDFCGAPSRNG